jgi:dTDP-4-amino-4,6-dideoxygalactose transaminase
MPKQTLPAIEGGAPTRSEFLPFARPSISDEDVERVIETLRSGWLTVGPRTREFQEAVAQYIGVEKAAAVHSCTAGLHLSLFAFGVTTGDEVILPALNFAAAPNTVVHMGAKPVLVDVDPVTLNVTPEIIEEAVTDRTKVAIPVHFAGRPCRTEEILALGRARNIKILADGAHAIGASYDGKRVGSRADATSFSFYVTKGITTGEGGIVTSPDGDLIDRLARLSLHGMSSDAWKRYSDRGPWYYEILEPGYKYNMNDMQAALGLCQFERVDEFREARARIAHLYRDGLASEDAVTLPEEYDGGLHAWHLFPIQIDLDVIKIDRDRFLLALLEEGVGVSVHFIPIHYHPFYRKYFDHRPGAFPVTEEYFSRAISLPIYPTMSEDDGRDVVRAVTKLLRYYRR